MQYIYSVIMRRLLVTLLLTVMLAACGGGNSGESGQSQTLQDSEAEVTITLLHYNDLHAHLTPHTDIERIGGGPVIVERGGLARLATLVNSIRAENPQTLLMNIGDTFHGGVEALYTHGNAIAAPLNALGIDVGVPGNWDFAYGPAITRARYTDEKVTLPAGISEIKRPNFPNLAANVTYTAPASKAGQTFLPATLSRELNGIRVGFIGLTSDIVPRMSTGLAIGLDFLQGEEAYIALLERLGNQLRAEGAQLVVVMSELGLHKDYRLANRIKAGIVDVFFAAHTHEMTYQPLQSASGAMVVEAGNDGYLGRMDFSFSNGQRVAHDWQLLPIDRSLAEDPVVKSLVEQARAPFLDPAVDMQLAGGAATLTLAQPIDTVIGYQPQGLDRRNSLSNRFNQAFTEGLKQYSHSKLAMTPGFRFDAVIPSESAVYEDPAIVVGEVSIEDAYRFMPVPYTLSTAQVSGERLRQVIEANMTAVYSADIFRQAGGWLDGFAGLDLTVDLAAADGQRIVSMQYSDDGMTVLADDQISIAGCSRPFDRDSDTTLCSYDGFTAVSPLINPSTGDPWTAVEFLIHALAQGLLNGEVSTSDVLDLNATSLWPQGDYLQPLSGVATSQP